MDNKGTKDEVIRMIMTGLKKLNELAIEFEYTKTKDAEILEEINKFVFMKYSEVLAAIYFLIENGEDVRKQKPDFNLTAEQIANNFKIIIMLIVYDSYKYLKDKEL